MGLEPGFNIDSVRNHKERSNYQCSRKQIWTQDRMPDEAFDDSHRAVIYLERRLEGGGYTFASEIGPLIDVQYRNA